MDSESRLSEMDESQLSNPPPSDSDSSDSDIDVDQVQGEPADDGEQQQQQQQQIEWLATTRARRSTAGNRMKSMLANEEPDSDLELLFAEDEDDQGFSDAASDASDAQMDSSSDDDDDNDADGAGAGDELEGEKELERQAQEKRAAQRKRKAQAAIPAKFRKRVRIDAASEASTPTTPAARPAAPAPAPRPRKKSERLSWLPSPADLPTRASSRETTRMSKEQLHQQMVEREERRLKQLALMQKKAARMEALKKPPMTQEDRLREAEVVEERNSKSLNRWEVAERQREEERMAKLAALHQRTLKGPVITFWSGIGEARPAVVEEERPKKKRERVDKAKNKASDAAASKDLSVKDDVRNPKSNVLAPPNTAPLAPGPASPAQQAQGREPAAAPPPPTTTARFLPPDDVIQSAKNAGLENKTSPGPSEPGPHQAATVAHTTTTRNAIILRSFDENAIKDKSIQTQILFGRKMNKLTKPPSAPICAITNLPARYRDPKTGLPFHNAYAYREIQRLNRGEHHFSKILNAWVGSNTTAARGVPERFLNPDAPSKKASDGGDKAKPAQTGAQDPVKQEAQASPKPAVADPPQSTTAAST
ncbi:Vacuolar protein sorting-associated protein 72 -like protein [Escovopsis weberi]|uniref:Vacuolar protein sorting-associated protein 72-like protein n=1 Tax=Escovopsis weberi TaxID=150374 RepID=A0A0M8MPN5_ESCWE|nr:Vacuolar protein sorting-associated protein 72 -like protein [Escovopsis weberi]